MQSKSGVPQCPGDFPVAVPFGVVENGGDHFFELKVGTLVLFNPLDVGRRFNGRGRSRGLGVAVGDVDRSDQRPDRFEQFLGFRGETFPVSETRVCHNAVRLSKKLGVAEPCVST